jgi:hypothetical protein
MTLVELLAGYAGVTLETRRDDPCLQGALLVFGSGGQRLIVVERTYREGIVALVDPTEEEVAMLRQGDLWKIWNSDRAEDLVVV